MITIGGYLDCYAAGELKEALPAGIEGGTGDVVISLQGVDFLDETCLGVLAGVHKQLRDGPTTRSLRLVPDTAGHLTRLLQLMGLTAAFDLYSNLDEALTASCPGVPVGGMGKETSGSAQQSRGDDR
ncbi:STAS domain-containing protein [Streptomyces decoyicus]|uniref:STAS domain-containing protein n=1 Tax=Streptomyces decoyicus TaxID=249567 RepID=UPI00364BB23E